MDINELNIPKNIIEPKLGLCGFKNMGNTCYMNSILQLLVHSRMLINFLLCESNPFENLDSDKNTNLTFTQLVIKDKVNATFIKFLKENTLERLAEKERKRLNLDDFDPVDININEYEMHIEKSLVIKLAEIINNLIYKGNSCITPLEFKKILDKKIPSLRGFGQQDAHELLIGIFDILIEETGCDSEPIINNVPNTIKEYHNLLQTLRKKVKETNSIEKKKEYIIELNEYKKINHETINKFSGLKFMTEVFSKKRKNLLDTSTTGYTPTIFNLLTFNLNIFKCTQCNNIIYKYEFDTILSLDVKPTLKECFENFVKEEILERKCEICNNDKVIKKKNIWRPGMLLYIQLCRFNNLPNGKVWKNNQSVEIPSILDISEFCDNSMKTEKSLTYKYKLKGISNHMGSLNGGHYTADAVSIVDNESWYHFDDSNVGRHQTVNIDKSSAYILMYEMEFD
jgi:ubiquitin C-terminal hydrolase